MSVLDRTVDWLAAHPNAASAIATGFVAIIALVSLALEMLRSRRERSRVNDRIRAGAYPLAERISSWRDQIAAIKGGTLEERRAVVETIWADVEGADERLEHLLVEASRATGNVSELVARSVVNFHRAVGRIRRTMTSPRIQKEINRGQTAGVLTDESMKALMDYLRAANRPLRRLVPEEVSDAQEDRPRE